MQREEETMIDKELMGENGFYTTHTPTIVSEG